MVGEMKLPELFKREAERKKLDAEELLKGLVERHRTYISRLMFLQGGEGNIFEQSCKIALRMLTNNGVDEFHIECVKAEIRASKATMERDAAIRQGLKMEEDTSHYVSTLTNWIDNNFNSLNNLAQTSNWSSEEGELEISPSVQTIWDFTSKIFRFKGARYLGQQPESTDNAKPFLSTATMLTPSRKARFLAQFEGSPVHASPRRSPRKFKVSTPKRNGPQFKKRSPRKEKKKVRWTEAPPQEFQLPQDLTPLPSPAIFAITATTTSVTDEGDVIKSDPSRPIFPLPLRKAKTPNFGSAGILKTQLYLQYNNSQQSSVLSNKMIRSSLIHHHSTKTSLFPSQKLKINQLQFSVQNLLE